MLAHARLREHIELICLACPSLTRLQQITILLFGHHGRISRLLHGGGIVHINLTLA
jgi:hypothetical protein